MCYVSGGRNRCVDPCSTISPCVAQATCQVYSTTPTRTMSCTCFEGYTGNGVVSCDKISKLDQISIRKLNLLYNYSSLQLPQLRLAAQVIMNVPPVKPAEIELVLTPAALITHVEVVPSALQTTIGPTVNAHQDLQEIHTADVYLVRFRISLAKIKSLLTINFSFLVQRGECQHDIDCPDNRACIENQCLDPCIVHSPCGKSGLCETTSHRPVCRCPSGWAGDPHTECYQCRF